MKSFFSTSRCASLCICLFFSYALLVSTIAPLTTRTAYASSGLSTTGKSTAPFGQSSQQVASRPGEVLVRFRPNATEHDKHTVAATHGAQRKKLKGDSRVEKLQVSSGQSAGSLAFALQQQPEVELAEPNFLIQPDQAGEVVPNDEQFASQWGLRNTGQDGGQFGSDINVAKAWQSGTGSQSTVIAVIDSGVDFNHPDLANNKWTNPHPGADGDLQGWDYITDSETIKDEHGHGTALAGIIAAQGNNAQGVAGVMWRASLMSLRVLDNTGTGDIADAVEAIDYAVSHGAHVINISWGTGGESQVLKEALERALARGVVVVCSAGNGGQDLESAPYYPAAFGLRDLVTVAASDNFDQLASWSNWSRRHVTIAAPGTSILTTKMGGGYWSVQGTSAAAPFVTGVAGLLKSAQPYQNAPAIARAIDRGARKVASLSGKVNSSGVINASDSLEALRSPVAVPSNPSRPPGYGTGGNGPGGSFSTNPPSPTTEPPSGSLPNLNDLRNATAQSPRAREPIQSNLMCADCDPLGGGGGGSYYPSSDPNFSTARMRPANRTGQPGVNLGSRNFNWSLPLVSLTGRAGMDLSLSLSYNSLVWTKDGSYIKYNADLGSPAPGFRIGLPILQQRFLDSQTGTYAYMMVTPSGGRVEMRQVGSSNIYESQDGSYTQLDISNPNAPVVRTTDGTQFSFVPVTINSEYRCTQIKDRNGNFISATYNTTNGHLQQITDTLGRVITFVYDANNNLERIRQTWAGVAHDWATFSYGQVYVAPGFGGGLVVNGPNGSYVSVLTQVSLHDGSYFTFNYNAAFGQVNRINGYAADGHLLSYTSYNLDASAGQTDCPRFTERRDWAEYGVMDQSQEVVTSYSVATDGSWSQQTAPDGTIHKEFFSTSGWQSGLPYQTETWSNSVKKKWTTISWTQDDTGLSYQKNPRPTEINVYDPEGNRKRTTLEYNAYSLPQNIREWGGVNGDQLLRRSEEYYRWDAEFVNRRIIGLPSAKLVYEGESSLVSKIEFHYDWQAGFMTAEAPGVQHDTANYGSAFSYGRGIVVGVLRYNIQAPNDGNQATWLQLHGYNLAGSTTFIQDHAGHRTSISYADAWSDGTSRNTLAFPTTVTDADNFSSTSQYNYDFGATTRTQDPKGAVSTMSYDPAARISQVNNLVNNAYTRWVYPAAMNSVQQFTTIQAGAGEAYSVDYLDGWGKTRVSVSEHPGSAGGYSATYLKYDAMGRVVWQSNSTEVNAGVIPAGDDAAGWVATTQTYDWKGRSLLTTNPDGTTREASYGGCGCAGGEVTTIRDERGRRRKLTVDVLGRLKLVDELNWNQSIYSTTSYTYNARDQITESNQAGQLRTFAYDGHGRLSSRTTPEQGTMTYSYFADDTVQTITDARGATTTFSYNNRHLPTGITFGVPGGVAATPNVSFAYDNAGNRTSMTDGLGSVSYSYDTLSQLTSETRTFTGVGSFSLNYSYNLAGELTNITNPWNAQVGYSYDKVGRPTSISGSGYYGVGSYVNSISYRAFGAKQMASANGRTLSLTYDNRQRVTRWDVPGVMGWNYSYNNFGEHTGRVTYAQNLYDATLDRSYDYDQVGRLIEARTGGEARGHLVGQGGAQDGPYAQSYNYDKWGNLTSRGGWGGANPSYTASFNANNRMLTNPGNGQPFSYDAAGNVTSDGGQTFTYDATGQQVTGTFAGLQSSYDGDRLRGKKVENGVATYYLRSSVLGGQVVAEVSGAGGWSRGYVYLGGQLIAIQNGGVNWVHQDPVTKSQRLTNSAGTVVATIDLDPWGGSTNRNSNDVFQPHRYTTYERDAPESDDAMHRRYNRWWSRFDQPDPYNGSYSLADPQSFNRYAYVQNDPVNFTDPSGLMTCGAEFSYSECGGGGGFWGGGGFGGNVAEYNREYGGMTSGMVNGLRTHNERMSNAQGGNGYRTSAEVIRDLTFQIRYWLYSDGSVETEFLIGMDVHTSLAWHERGAMGQLNLGLRGFANEFTMGFVSWVERRQGRLTQEEQDWLANTRAHNAGAWTALAAGIIIPGPGKVSVAAKGAKFFRGFANRNGFGHAVRQIGRFTEFSVSVVGNNGMSYTRYVKVVNENGRTIRFYHDTFTNTGRFIHRH